MVCVHKNSSKKIFANKAKYKWQKSEHHSKWGNHSPDYFEFQLNKEQNNCNSQAIYFPTEIYNKKYRIEKFQELYEKWNEDIGFSSNGRTILESEALAEIIAMGKDVIPLILESYRRTPHHWSFALTKITGQNPVKEEHIGNLILMSEDWIEWGKKNNYID